MDTGRPRIDIVRERDDGGDEPFTSDREAFAQQQAANEHDASAEQPMQEEPEEFRKRMGETLKDSGKNSSKD